MIFDTHTHLNVSAFTGEERGYRACKRTRRNALLRWWDSIRTRLHEVLSSVKSSKKFSIIGWHPTEA